MVALSLSLPLHLLVIMLLQTGIFSYLLFSYLELVPYRN